VTAAGEINELADVVLKELVLDGWSRWPEILWRRFSTRGPLADQLRPRDAAATIYAAGAVTATVDTVSRARPRRWST